MLCVNAATDYNFIRKIDKTAKMQTIVRILTVLLYIINRLSKL